MTEWGKDVEGEIPILSLFCGPGGLDLGFEQAGFHPLLALDVDPIAVDTYNRNRPRSRDAAVCVDLSSTSPDDLIKWWAETSPINRFPKGIIGGPPCQSFSVSNVHKLQDDPRSALPLAYAQILRAFHDQFDIDFFVFENVAGLGHQPHQSSLDMFRQEFEDAGFAVTLFYLDAVDFGVPQYRKRMFIVGFNKDQHRAIDYVPPIGNCSPVTVRQAIGNLPDPVFFSRLNTPRDAGLHPNHWCLNPRSPKFQDGSLQPGKMIGRSFRMLAWDVPSWTVAYGHREVHVHPCGTRRLSIYEAMRIQSFPEEYELFGTLSDQIRLVSDAVPPPVAEVLGTSIRNYLEQFGENHSARGKAQVYSNGQLRHSGALARQIVAPRSTTL